jgi:sulfhydrogenase subunit beta (sulfur reductase)
MESRTLSKDRLDQLVDALIEDYQVIAPRDERSYGEIGSVSEWRRAGDKPAQSLKPFFLPERELLVRYTMRSSGIELVEPPSPRRMTRVILGAPPCDVAALPLLDLVFQWDDEDSLYLERRESTAIIAMACDEPCTTCFCTSLGGSPAGTEGADLLLTELADAYHVAIVSERGRALVERYSDLFGESGAEHERQRTEAQEASLAKMPRQVDVEGLDETLDFDDPVWETLTQQCLDCGICTFLCPTCHCFDIQDEGTPEQGERVRLWDACTFPSYTRAHAGQPRPVHYRRYRQRIMHKFRYYPENFGRTLCVGCGRCIEHCPVSIDLRQVLTLVRTG